MRTTSSRSVVLATYLSLGISVAITACGDSDDDGMDVGDSGAAGDAGRGGQPRAGGGTGNGGSAATAGISGRAGGGSGGVQSMGGSGGDPMTEAGAGAGGDGGARPNPITSCVYQSPPIANPPVQPGAGGAGGAGGAAASGGAAGGSDAELGGGGSGGAAEVPDDITVRKSSLIGPFLADSEGLTLYVWHRDVAGDCDSEPVSDCAPGDCLTAWPVFNAGERKLPDTLSDSAFGTILRDDGLYQTTYNGWPLYYYYRDVKPDDLVGQGKGTWHVAQVTLPNIVRQGSTNAKLADGNGRTLYTYAEDRVGTATVPPLSACVGSCANDYVPFELPTINPALYMQRADFTVFARSDGGVQIAYKGKPLYWSVADDDAADRNGEHAPSGWAVAIP